VFGWLQADTVAAVWTAAAAIHREKNTVEAAAAAGLKPQQAAANKLDGWMHCSTPHAMTQIAQLNGKRRVPKTNVQKKNSNSSIKW
jgi:hypothetical protein